MKDKVVAEHYQHIDNGGVSFSIILRNEDDIYLKISSQYYGYPSLQTEMKIDQDYLKDNWLQKIGLMFISAAEKLKNTNQK